MNKERLRFFVSCPACKRKFGIKPETVLKYVDRLLSELDKEFKEAEQGLKQSQANKEK